MVMVRYYSVLVSCFVLKYTTLSCGQDGGVKGKFIPHRGTALLIF
jgi:hypothetical protein